MKHKGEIKVMRMVLKEVRLAVFLCMGMCADVAVAAAPKPFVFNGPTITNVAGRDGWRETPMSDIVVRAGTALDLSGLDGHAPAGAYGWAKPFPDGSLRFENRPGERIRLYGCVEGNISYQRIFDGCGTVAERRAAIDGFVLQTRRMGFNFIRPHGILDNAFDIGRFKGCGTFREDQLDEIDYFLSVCKKSGIYVYIDLAAYRLRDPKERSQIWRKAGVMVKEPGYWALWENCTRAILERVNRYTGLAWKDDPAVIGVMEYNEQASGAKIALQRTWKNLDPAVKRAYVDGFAAWLAENAPGVQGLDVEDSTPNFYGKDRRGRLLHLYLSGLFSSRALDYNSVVRSTGYKGLLTTYNSDVDLGACAARWRASEAVPYNFHAGHPHGGGHGYRGARVSQRSTIESMASGSAFCYGNRIRLADRPYIVTENSHAFWNDCRYESALMLPAYGALNGYSGILWHEGGGDTKATGKWPRGHVGVFKISTSPAMRAATFLGSMLYRRGDVSEAARSVNIAVNDGYWRKHSASAPSTTQAKLSLVFKYGLTFPGQDRPSSVNAPLKADVTLAPGTGDEIEDGLWVSNVREKESKDFDIDAFIAKMKRRGILPAVNATSPKDGIYQSVTGEITLNAPKKEFLVVTPRTEAVCLQAGTGRRLGVLSIEENAQDCCAALTSVDGRSLSESRRMVFLWITKESNEGMVTSKDGKTMVNMSRYPALLKTGRIAFTARVAKPEKMRLWLLGYSGVRLEEVPVRIRDGALVADFDTSKLKCAPTPFFELAAGL